MKYFRKAGLKDRIVRTGLKQLLWLILFFSWTTAHSAFAVYPLTVKDDTGSALVFEKRPQRVVSLVPSLTEILFEIGADTALQGSTYHSDTLSGATAKKIVGGFSHPAVPEIEKIRPDMILLDARHEEVRRHFQSKGVALLELHTNSLAASYAHIRLLGRIFDCTAAAEAVVAENQALIERVKKKIDRIPLKNRKRVMRLMGREEIMTPGSDSFQNEFIRLAGGIPPEIDATGPVVPMDTKSFVTFDPQVIYGCDGDRKAAEYLYTHEDTQNVTAVREKRILYFPCELTCRVAAHSGYFISWLAARIYGAEFADESRLIQAEAVFNTRPLSIDLPYIHKADIAYSHIYDFTAKTLRIGFNRPMTIVSTLEGLRTGIRTVGNHYMPPQTWAIGHNSMLDTLQRKVMTVLGRDRQDTSLLFTGADMDNLSLQTRRYRDMSLTAAVTAGVMGNAVRMSRDTGAYYEPGTINIILMTNMRLTRRAMTRAIITATEAKSAALSDLDIRSTHLPLKYGATGTGTDNMIVVEGTGARIDNAGGHSKMGELIAAAVYAGVQEAIAHQNGVTIRRSVFQRLKERGITPHGLTTTANCDCGANASGTTAALEALLLEPRYAGFIETALVVSDAAEKGLIQDTTAFNATAREIAVEIAGKNITDMKRMVARDDFPAPLRTALNALLNGIYHRDNR